MAATITTIPNEVKFCRDSFEFYLTTTALTFDPNTRYSVQMLIKWYLTGTGLISISPPVFFQHGDGFNNLSERLTAAMESHSATRHLPAYGASNLALNFSFCKYLFLLQEYSGTPLAASGSADSTDNYANFYALYGGSAFDKYNGNAFLNNYFTGLAPFLTNAPVSKRTQKDCQEFLSFLIPGTPPTNFKTFVKLTYTDGTFSSYRITQSSGSYPAWDYTFWRAPAGYAALNIDANKIKEVWYYEVQVQDNSNNPLTEIRKFIVDPIPYAYKRKLIWKNSKGGEDSFYFTGLGEYTTEITQSSSAHYIPIYGAEIMEGQMSTANKLEQGAVKVSTFLESLQEAHWLRDLKLSSLIFEDNGSNFLPIEIIPGTFSIEQASASGYRVEFEYKYKFKNHSITL